MPYVNQKRLGPATVHGHPATAELFRLMVERIKDYAIFLLDPDGSVVSWNEGLRRIKGYTAAEIIGRHMSIFYTPEDANEKLPERLLEIARTEGQVENEGWRVRKDGSRFWADVVITALRDDKGSLRGFGKVTRDLTERKAVHDALGEVAGRLVRLQDEERRMVGRELHDTTGPLLTSLTGKLYSACQCARAGSPELSGMLDEALTLTEATASLVRTMSSMLDPPLLADSGLLPALRWYAGTFARKTGLHIDLELSDTMERIAGEREVILFRVTQETLQAARQGRATRARLQVTSSHNQVTLVVEAHGDWSAAGDDLRIGRGETGAVFAGMKERVRQLGGNLEMKPTYGTLTVQVHLPAA